MCEIQSQNNGDIRIVCVEKRTGKLNIFFSNKNGPERGRRIHAQCVQWFLASLHPAPTMYIYILCDVVQHIIQKSRKCGKKPSKYMSERYIYVCGCRPYCEVWNVNLKFWLWINHFQVLRVLGALYVLSHIAPSSKRNKRFWWNALQNLRPVFGLIHAWLLNDCKEKHLINISMEC